jgi:hypothetical protein
MTQSGEILVPLGIAALMAALVFWMNKTDDLKLSQNKIVKLLGKIGDYVSVAIAACFYVPFLLGAVYALGALVSALPVWLVSLFSERLADSLSRMVYPDWPLHLGLLIPAAVGCLTIMCGLRISRAWNRKRAIEKDIMLLSEIQIVEPPPPSRVERFYEKDGALDRFFERYFWWIEDIGDKWSRLGELFAELPIIVRLLVWFVLVLIVFTLGASVMWIKGEPFQARWWMIPAAVVVGFAMIYIGFWIVWLASLAIMLPLAAPYYAWRAVKSIRQWLAENLPHRVVLWDRQWQLRRLGQHQLQGYETKAATRSPLEWLLTLVAVALLALAVAGGGWVLKHANNDTGEENDTEPSLSTSNK